MNKCRWFSFLKHIHNYPSCCFDYKVNCDSCQRKNKCAYKNAFHLFSNSNYTMVYNIANLFNLCSATLYSPYINFSKTLKNNRYTFEILNDENKGINFDLFDCKTTSLVKNLDEKYFLITSMLINEYEKKEKILNFARTNHLRTRVFVGNIHQKELEGFTILIYK